MVSTAVTKLGQLLLQKGLLTEAQLKEALQQQAASKQFLGSIILERRWASPEQLLQALSEQYRMPFVRLSDESFDRTALQVMPLTGS